MTPKPGESPTGRLRLAYVRFTSCSGCQLALLNCELELAPLGAIVELVRFDMASSKKDDGEALAAVLIEGSISTPEELSELLELRRRSEILVAVGACALSGGVNALNGADRAQRCRSIYAETAGKRATFNPQPLSRFVRVDLKVPGCPPEGGEQLRTLASLARGGLPALPEYAVCMECRQRENRCLLLEGRMPCLGPVTRAGCDALCPSFGIICEGCRGETEEANRDEEFRLLLELGLSEGEIRSRMRRFTGEIHEND